MKKGSIHDHPDHGPPKMDSKASLHASLGYSTLKKLQEGHCRLATGAVNARHVR